MGVIKFRMEQIITAEDNLPIIEYRTLQLLKPN